MEILNLAEWGLGEKLETLWRNYPQKERYPPLYPKMVRKKVLTFLSLNPSLNPQERNANLPTDSPYPFIDCQVMKPNEIPHFKKFYKIGSKLSQPWSSIDLLYQRETHQRKTLQTEIDFLIKQMQITFQLLEAMNPKLVVVANGGVDKLIHQHQQAMGLKISAQNSLPIYTINDIPFVIKESRYISNWRLLPSIDKEQRMLTEIKRVIDCISI